MSRKNLASHVSTKKTDQKSKVPGKAQVKNSAGGYVFALDKWKRLERFLILGTDGGAYYVGERELTQDNAEVVRACLAENPERTVKTIVDISEIGIAPKNEPAILALAICARDKAARYDAYAALHRVCRIGTHLFHFAEYTKALGGWGRATRNAFARWYKNRPNDSLVQQVIKYQQRDGWSHRDLLCKAHPKPVDPVQGNIFKWVMGAGVPEGLPPRILAFEEAKRLTAKGDLKKLCDLVLAHDLPHECVPNEQKKAPELWDALLPSMGLTAVLRNLARMTSIGLLKPLGVALDSANARVLSKLYDADAMKKQRVHPIAILIALKTYEQGHGDKGALTWVPVPSIVEALNDAFYAAFDAVVPSGKATLVGCDVSGSMSQPLSCCSALSAFDGAVALSMVTTRTEPNSMTVAFSAPTSGGRYGGMHDDAQVGLTPLTFSKSTRLDQAIASAHRIPMGGTDCSAPIRWALDNKIPAEVFHVITDNETWAGKIHPFQALREYREKTGINAKMIVVGMTSTGFTIADPSDAGMLDVVGFDAGVPSVMADFAR